MGVNVALGLLAELSQKQARCRGEEARQAPSSEKAVKSDDPNGERVTVPAALAAKPWVSGGISCAVTSAPTPAVVAASAPSALRSPCVANACDAIAKAATAFAFPAPAGAISSAGRTFHARLAVHRLGSERVCSTLVPQVRVCAAATEQVVAPAFSRGPYTRRRKRSRLENKVPSTEIVTTTVRPALTASSSSLPARSGGAHFS